MSAVLEPAPAAVGETERAAELRPARIDPGIVLFKPWAVAAMAAIVADWLDGVNACGAFGLSSPEGPPFP